MVSSILSYRFGEDKCSKPQESIGPTNQLLAAYFRHHAGVVFAAKPREVWKPPILLDESLQLETVSV